MYPVFMYRGCGVYIPCICVPTWYLWWSLSTLYLCTEDVPQVEFMYLVFMYRGCTSGGVYVPCIYVPRMYLVEFMYLVFMYRGCTWWSLYTCIYTHARRELL